MEKYKFNLAPGYSIYKSAVIFKQNGPSIRFLMYRKQDKRTRNKLRKAFYDYLTYVRKQEDCPKVFYEQANVEFIYVSREQIRNFLKKKLDEEKFCK